MQLNPNKDKYYLRTPYRTLKPPLKKISIESIRAIARDLNLDLQSLGIFNYEISKITLELNKFKNFSLY